MPRVVRKMLTFMQNFFAAKANPIGVDFGTDSLRLAQVQFTPSGEYRLFAAASADLPHRLRRDPAARMAFFIESTRDLLVQGKFRGRQAILALPAASMIVQHLRMPRLPEDELKKALAWEAKGVLPIDPSHALMRHIVAGEIYQDQEPRHEVIVLAAAQSFVQQFLAAAAKARLDVIGMNIEPKAIVDCFAAIYRRKTDAEAISLFIDIGCGSTRALIAQQRQIFFARTIPIGGDHFTQAVADAMKISFGEAKLTRAKLAHVAAHAPEAATAQQGDEIQDDSPNNNFTLLHAAATGTATLEYAQPKNAVRDHAASSDLSIDQSRCVEHACAPTRDQLIEELNLCRRYYEATFPDRPVDRLIFVGGEARQRSLCAQIAREVGLAAQVGDPLVRMGRISDITVESGIDRRQPQPNWAVAIGLSIGPNANAPGAGLAT
jgi:type IV pilus assembly protein PilM